MRTTFLTAVALVSLLLLTNLIGGADKKKEAKKKGIANQPPPKMPAKPTKEELEKSRRTAVGGKTFDQWKSDLTNPDAAVVENAIRTIILYGPDLCREVVPILIGKLKRTSGSWAAPLDVSIKVNVIMFLGVNGLPETDLEDGVTCLNRLLLDDQAIVRLQTALTLGRIGWDAKDTIDNLLRKLKDPTTWEVRKACARALATVALPPKDYHAAERRVIQALCTCARQDRCFQVRLEAVQTLISLGRPGTSKETKALLVCLKHVADDRLNFFRKKEDETVRLWAQVAIMRIDKIDKKRMNYIGKLLNEDNLLGVRCQAARALGVIGSDAGSQVDYLIPALEDKDPIMVGWTVWALANIGNKARRAVRPLEKLAKSIKKDDGFKLTVEDAIKAIKDPKLVAKEDIKQPMVKPKAE